MDQSNKQKYRHSPNESPSKRLSPIKQLFKEDEDGSFSDSFSGEEKENKIVDELDKFMLNNSIKK